jgi:hypothetical protein
MPHGGREESEVGLKLLRMDARMARAQDALERPDLLKKRLIHVPVVINQYIDTGAVRSLESRYR